MAKKQYPSDKQDQFMLRLPDGLRGRIKRYAEAHGRSMNAEIVRVLEREYPEKWPLDGRLAHLLEMIRLMRVGVDDDLVDQLGLEMLETVEGIAYGRIGGVDDNVRKAVKARYDEWTAGDAKETWRDFADSLDPEEIDALANYDTTAKYVDPEFPDPEK